MGQELKPCPFCGNKWPTITYNSYSDSFDFACPNCDFKGGFGYGSASVHYGSTERAREKAVEAWNRRPV